MVSVSVVVEQDDTAMWQRESEIKKGETWREPRAEVKRHPGLHEPHLLAYDYTLCRVGMGFPHGCADY